MESTKTPIRIRNKYYICELVHHKSTYIMNKKALFPLISLFLLVTGIILPESVRAQISEGGIPASFKYSNTLKSDLPGR